MNIQQLLEIVVLGCVRGAIYSLIAIGFSLVFGVARVINLAHGVYYMFGGYFVYFLLQYARFPLLVSIVVSIALVACFGWMVDYVLIRPKRQSEAYVTIVTLSLAFFSSYILFALLGARPRNIPYLIPGSFYIGGVPVSWQRILIFMSFIAVIAALVSFLRFSLFGKAMQAVAQNYDASLLLGISSERIFVFTSALAASMAGLAGILVGPLLLLHPLMWFFPLAKSFAIVILGGIGSVKGSVIAAFILGFSEVMTTMLFSTYFENMVSLVIIIFMLIIRPSGLFGSRF